MRRFELLNKLTTAPSPEKKVAPKKAAPKKDSPKRLRYARWGTMKSSFLDVEWNRRVFVRAVCLAQLTIGRHEDIEAVVWFVSRTHTRLICVGEDNRWGNVMRRAHIPGYERRFRFEVNLIGKSGWAAMQRNANSVPKTWKNQVIMFSKDELCNANMHTLVGENLYLLDDPDVVSIPGTYSVGNFGGDRFPSDDGDYDDDFIANVDI